MMDNNFDHYRSSQEDVEMADASHDNVAEQAEAEDMGYEECAPEPRRGSMTAVEETERRASIKAVMADSTLSPMAKRLSIQYLMDGRRTSITNSVCSSVNDSSEFNAEHRMNNGSAARRAGSISQPTNTTNNHHLLQQTPSQEYAAAMYGYGDAAPDAAALDQHEQAGAAGAGGVICNESTKSAERGRPACHHYDRKCTMIAPCCGAAFGCRICHDECPALPPKINNGGTRYHRSASLPSSFTNMNLQATAAVPEENHHTIDRFAVSEVICRECFTRQSSKTNHCVSCPVQFGAYHCDICNLWMSNEESPYHCADCGFCRVGGQANFQHCHQCGMCIDRGLYQSHNCKAGKYRSNCPVCQEYLFSSRGASHEMPCGHAIHWDCFRQLAAHDSRCPVCKKTAETRERMMPTWDAMAGAVAMQPVPPELARVVSIACNDCERSEEARAWHFLGMQCSHCQSFNTVVDRIALQGEEAHEFLEVNRQRAALLAEQQQQQHADEQEHRSNSNGEERHSSGGRGRRRVNRRRSAM